MKIITSNDNQLYKSAIKLTRKKYRDETGLYLLEGIKPLEDALSMGIKLRNVFICEDNGYSHNFQGQNVVSLSRKLFAGLSDTKNSQGVIAIAEKIDCDTEAFCRKTGSAGSNIVVLDKLQDPGNIGTIIRTAEAAGYKGMMLTAGSGDVYSPKVVRAAAGSLFRMPVMYVSGSMEAIEILHRMNKRIITTALDADMCYYEADLKDDVALVIGNEGRGVSAEFIAHSDVKIMIPMEGSIESLNAAVAAGIIMYQSQKIN